MNTIQRGNAAEAAVLYKLISAGIHVLVPFGGGLAFDLGAVVPPDGDLLRIQVKSGRVRRDCVAFNSCSTDHGTGRQSYDGRADIIAVHELDSNRIFMVPVAECPTYVGALRLHPPRNNQRRGIRFAEDYSFETWIRRLGQWDQEESSLEQLAHG
jgi:hypothetical protein